ncbi:Dfp1/Him1, central region-domain-containing protein [Mucor lusitanicus]|uniref:DBF4-type domain-containing protein n=2 Tax=Mucor circinelloides f. lusitanicus TaxID=29924 RepID=A0A162MRT3_MUCCL|nr:Dfp1/Him1, central region-domain-containing protein [Mucor lusitanicus]OAD04705.1 hypothetical protein MUCCIDRAFT_79807 [Mucor lusitanicus CBS 277.49]
MSYPLNNNTNTVRQVNQQHTWMKPGDLHLPRQTSISREQELQNKLKQTSLNPAAAAATAPTARNVNSDDFCKISPAELAAKRKEFGTFKFYLDNLDPLVSKRIERGIKIMGAAHEPFFSKKCTHLITTKPIPKHENLLATTSNNSTTSNTKATKSLKKYDPIVESAIQFNTVVWSADVMQKTIEFLLNVTSSRKEAPVQEKRALGNLLQEDKLFGPSTGTNSDAQSKRPHFVPFTGFFLIVEDATQAHRPPICKQWTKDTKKPAEMPWPYFKQTPKFRSPFGKRGPPPPKKPADGATAGGAKDATTAAKEETTKPTAAEGVPATTAKPKTTADNKTAAQEDKENMPTLKPTTSCQHAAIKPLTATSTPSPLSSQKSQSQQLHHPQQQTTLKQPDSQNFSLRASGFQPSCTNNIQSASTRSVSTSVSILQGEHRRLPPGDSVNRLDKRMVENVTQKEHEKLCRLKAQKEEQARRERELKKKRDSRFCENCNVLFENLEEHAKQQAHQTFIRDQNNFKELDELLAKTHRRYKGPLPERMRELIDPNIDGKNVEFVPDRKRPHPATPADDMMSPTRKLQTADMLKKKSLPTSQPRIAANDTHHNVNHKWAEYGAVFD